MKSSTRIRSRAAITAFLLLVLASAVPAQAADWLTRGGSTERANIVAEPSGQLDSDRTHWWEGNVGQSATQPVMVGNQLFHLAGLGLYRLTWDSPGAAAPNYRIAFSANVNPEKQSSLDVSVSHSTPTYSPAARRLYFGTAYGWLWGVNADKPTLYLHQILSTGCQIVSSPLVVRMDNRDLVVVGMKPVGDGCTLGSGKIYLVWGLDGVGAVGSDEYDIGGWATPSAVPGASPDEIIVGSDGTGCADGNGKVQKLKITPTGDPVSPYTLIKSSWGSNQICVPNGVADGFAEAGGYVYWVDTQGWLWARAIGDGSKHKDWPAEHLDLAALLGGGSAFTNTVPAIDLDGGMLYVTLRNYVAPGEALDLRGCPAGGTPPCPGAPGAIAAIHLADGSLAWKQRLDPTPAFDTWAAANTNPLILKTAGAVVFSDVHGNVHSFALHDGQPLDVVPDTHGAFTLLHTGATPNRAANNYSQESGAGTEPIVASGTMGTNSGWTRFLVGVNIEPPAGTPAGERFKSGRLVAIPMGLTYDLAWAGPAPTELAALALDATVTLQSAPGPLSSLRATPDFKVSWFLAPSDWDAVKRPGGVVNLGQATSLPGTLTGSAPVSLKVDTLPADGGLLIGVIDAEGLARMGNLPEAIAARALLGAAHDPKKAFTPPNVTEMVTRPDGTNGLANNFLTIPVKAPVDLAVENLSAPAEVACPDNRPPFPVAWVIQNRSTRTVSSIPVEIRVTDGLGTRPFTRIGTYPPGDTRGSMNVPLRTCGGVYTVTVRVNLPEPGVVPETDFQNNSASVTTAVDEAAVVDAGNPTGGRDDVIIVPADCEANPDATSRQPCLNYPHLIIP